MLDAWADGPFGVKVILQLDLGYLATSYLDISIIWLWSSSVYCLFFIHFQIISCSKQKQSGPVFILFYMYVLWMIICYKYSSNEY